MWIFKTKVKDIQQGGRLAIVLLAISLMALTATQALAQEPVPILELTISDTARVVDYDNGIHVVGTSGGDLHVIDEAGGYTITSLGAGRINDVRIENGFIAVAAGTTVIELSLSGLTPGELWRTTLSGWREVVSTDLSEDGDKVCYLARRNASYTNAGEVGVLSGTDGLLIDRKYASGWVYCNWWIDATADMEHIAASQPMYGCCYQVGVALYQFDSSTSTLTMNWWKHLIPRYETTEVRISEAKDYIAVATSSGEYMKLLRVSDGAILGSYYTPGKEQYACDGDDYLNIVIGANQAWSPPYGWFILWNLGASGYQVLDEGTMSGRISDLDSNSDASLLAFGSDAGEFILLRRSGGTIETIFDEDIDKFIDAIEIGSDTLLVGGSTFINLYGWNRPPVASCQNVTVEAEPGCEADASIDAGSYDPDGDPITITQDPEGPYPLGDTLVTLTVTDGQVSDTCTATVTVEDTTPPLIVVASVVSQLVEVIVPVNYDCAVDDDCDPAVEWDFGDGDASEDIITEHAYADPGVYTATLTVTDSSDNWSAEEFIVVVYDPSGGFVTGGGWIDSPSGAYTPDYPDDEDLTGKANFGFVSKYKKGANVPTGNTEFQFHAGDLNFHSSDYQWLVVTGNDYARYKGSGTINGEGDYKFMLWAGDDEPDVFRIKIWTEIVEIVDELEVVLEIVEYDNGFEGSGYETGQPISGGNIIVHTGKK